MARYKYIDTNPKFIPIDLARQLMPGTFEYALHHLLEHSIDLSHFDARYRNDETGAPAYPPSMLLKVVLFAYSRGIVSSRGIERACEENVTFIALSGDTRPHFTTIANFVSTLGDDISRVFAAVLAVCDEEGLIGREMFAIDGVKMPSNASKQRSGLRKDFEGIAKKLETQARTMLERHRSNDELSVEPTLRAKEIEQIARLNTKAGKIQEWLTANPDDKKGFRGKPTKSNLTDNESAKMASNKGFIQGYIGVAAVDSAHQIIVEAQAHGVATEHKLLLEMVEAMNPMMSDSTLVTADSGYHSEKNLQGLADLNVVALIADNDMRKRDERFEGQERYLQLDSPFEKPRSTSKLFRPKDFTYDPVEHTCICPAGKSMWRKGHSIAVTGYLSEQFVGYKRDCTQCELRRLCLRNPGNPESVRSVAFFRGREDESYVSQTDLMRTKIDSPEGREQYGKRFQVVEPVFGNLGYNKRLNRFTLRGRTKVNGQWNLYCLVQNIEKLARNGFAA